MDIAKITDLQVNVVKKLNNETKKNLVKILDNEFVNQCTMYNMQNKEAKEKILDAYRKKCNFKKLIANIRKKESELQESKNILTNTGFNENGDLIYAGYSTPPEIKKKIEEIKDLLNKAEMQTPINLKNKIISRLWMADTMGEAMVILREVLGNGVIPTVTKDQLALSYKEEK